MIQESLPVKNYYDIMKHKPCYDPAVSFSTEAYCTREWEGTAYDVLRAEHVPLKDRIWLVSRRGWLPREFYFEFEEWVFNWAHEVNPGRFSDYVYFQDQRYHLFGTFVEEFIGEDWASYSNHWVWQEMVDWLVNEIEQRYMPVADKREE